MQNIKPLQTNKPRIMSNKEAMEELERYNPPKENKPQIINKRTNKNLETILVTVSDDNKLRVYSPPSFDLIKELNWPNPSLEDSQKICVCGFNTGNEDYIVSGGYNGSFGGCGKIGFYNFKLKLAATRETGNKEPINSVCPYYTKDGNFLISGGDDCVLRVYNSEFTLKELLNNENPSQIKSICTFRISPTITLLVVGGSDGILRCYSPSFKRYHQIIYGCDVNKGIFERTICVNEPNPSINVVKSVNLNKKDYLIVGFDNGRIVVNDKDFMFYKVIRKQLKVSDSSITSICSFNINNKNQYNLCNGKKILIGSKDRNVKVLNNNFDLEKSLPHIATLITPIGSDYIAFAEGRVVEVWDKSLFLVKELNQATDKIRDVCTITGGFYFPP